METPFSLDGKRILVTGASSGIGRGSALALSEQGAILIVSGRNEERLDACLRGLSGSGHRAIPFAFEGFDGIEHFVDSAAADGPLDGLLHCAGIEETRPIKATSEALYRRIMGVNADSAFALAKAFRRKAAHRSGASIVFLSSVAGIVGQAGHSAYSASKAALIGLGRSLAAELMPDGIRVNCILPGCVRTDLLEKMLSSMTDEQRSSLIKAHPLGLGEIQDVAFAAAYLLSDAARWVTGSCLVVDGGFSAVS